MNQMFDIYNNFSEKYDELVNHEDYKNNLYSFLHEKVEWNNKSVCEFGVGTGRVTKIYIENVKEATLLDNSRHMLDRASLNLSQWLNKLSIREFDNKDIHLLEEKFDILIEGWSFGHTVVNENEDVDFMTEKLITESLKKTQDKVVFIETMGTNVEMPKAPGVILPHFYKKLFDFGFEEHVIETNYEFSSWKEAARIMGNFFGESMKEDIITNQLKIINEYTGIWIYKK